MNKIFLGCIAFILQSNFVFSQKTLLPYRDGELWGLCDVKGKLVLNTVYDSIESIDNKIMFRTYKNGKQGAVYNGKEVVKPEGSYISDKDKRFFIDHFSIDGNPTLGSSRDIVYNLKGEKIINELVRDINLIPFELVKNDFIYVTDGINNNSEVFIYDDRTQKIKQVLLQHQPNFLEFGFSKEKKEIYIYSYSGAANSKKIIKYDDKLKKYNVITSTEKIRTPEYTIDDGMSGSFYHVKNNFSIKTIEFIQEKNSIKMIKINQKYKDAKLTQDTISLSVNFPEVKINKFIVDKKELYQYDSSPYNESDKEKIDSVFRYKNYVTFRKDGKIGFMVENKQIHPKFESIKFFRSVSDNKPCFLVSELSTDSKVKWGIIRSDGKYIIPVIYDEIIFNSTGGYGSIFILKNENKYGIALSDGTIVKEPQYDLILPNRLFYSLSIIDKGKHGFYDVEKNFCNPILPYKIELVYPFNDEKVLRLIDEKGKRIGYANFDGTLYFKD